MKTEPASQRTETVISGLLRWGVALSLVLAVTGTLLCFLRSSAYGIGGGTREDLQRLLHEGPGPSAGAAGFVQALLELQGQAVIVAGLMLLIATPVVRVLVSIVAFALEKDRAYVVITTIVFLLLAASFFLGKAG
jgi:uncharacterized membrane protein